MNRALLSLCLFLTACVPMHMHRRHDEGMHMQKPAWPTVRIDEPAGALVVMAPGVFGEGLNAKAPLEGKFQPTSQSLAGGYPLEILLDEATAHRYGSQKSLVVFARLNVAPSFYRHGTLLIAPSECELRALVSGDLEELRVPAEVLPTAEQACARKDAAGPHSMADCPMAKCPMHDQQQACGHGGREHGGGCQHGGGCEHRFGHGHGHGCGGAHHGWGYEPGAVLTLRLKRF